jgi:hypothetical protein
MSKTLMLLAAGALAALALTALPSAASAGEFIATCSNGQKECFGVGISTARPTLEDDGGARIECTGVAIIEATVIHSASTGTTQITFNGCKDEGTGFSCNNTGTSGEITTNTMTFHLVYLENSTTTPVGVLLTGVNVTFSCAGGLVKKTVTGNIIGEISNPQCGVNATSHSSNFESLALTGTQRWEQITTAGTLFDLTSGSETSDTTTSSMKGKGTVSWSGVDVRLDCGVTV